MTLFQHTSWLLVAVLCLSVTSATAQVENDPLCSHCGRSSVCPIIENLKLTRTDHACAEVDDLTVTSTLELASNANCVVDSALTELMCMRALQIVDTNVRARLSSQNRAIPTDVQTSNSCPVAEGPCREWCEAVVDSHAACFTHTSKAAFCSGFPFSTASSSTPCWVRDSRATGRDQAALTAAGSFNKYTCSTCKGSSEDRSGERCQFVDKGYRLETPGSCGALESEMDVYERQLTAITGSDPTKTCDPSVQAFRHYQCWSRYVTHDIANRGRLGQLGLGIPQCTQWEAPCRQWCQAVYAANTNCFVDLNTGAALTEAQVCGGLPTTACFQQVEANKLSGISSGVKGAATSVLFVVLSALLALMLT